MLPGDFYIRRNARWLLRPTQAYADGVIMPPNPGFYHHPQSVQDLVDFVVARILDHLGVEQKLVKPWGVKQ